MNKVEREILRVKSSVLLKYTPMVSTISHQWGTHKQCFVKKCFEKLNTVHTEHLPMAAY